jgi:hypothetical protein
MSEKTNEAEMTERVLALVNNTVTLALEEPEDKREAFLVTRRQHYIDDVMRVGGTEDEANEWAEKLDRWVRDLIGLIERTGGADGGKA